MDVYFKGAVFFRATRYYRGPYFRNFIDVQVFKNSLAVTQKCSMSLEYRQCMSLVSVGILNISCALAPWRCR